MKVIQPIQKSKQDYPAIITIVVINPATRLTQPGHLSVGERNEY